MANNPPDLQTELGPGMSEEAFRQAVLTSGYPLQTFVSAVLHDGGFRIEEEWAFTDSETSQRRALDLIAELPIMAPPVRQKARRLLISRSLSSASKAAIRMCSSRRSVRRA